MILKPVRLNKRDTCFSYVLKRVGVKSKIEFAKDIPKNALTPFNLNAVEVGNIVVWESAKSHHLYSTEIKTLQGKPALIRNHEFTGLHFGVVEAVDKVDGKQVVTISDCVRNNNSHSFPTILLATLTENEKTKETEARLPQYYLNYKRLENG